MRGKQVQVGSYTFFRAKKHLKDAIEAGEKVTFYGTSLFGHGTFDLAHLGKDGIDSFLVVGPDPARERKWYAVVEVNPKGGYRVK